MRRCSGILLHMTSLPSRYGIGDLGPEAYRFADFLADARQRFWQILPLNPTDPAYDNSPYHSLSAFAHNPLLISPELLIEDGLLQRGEVHPIPEHTGGRVQYEAAIAHKKHLFSLAHERFRREGTDPEYQRFCSENSRWLDDFALFVSLKDHFGEKSWTHWPAEIRDRQPNALQSLGEELHDRVELQRFLQYVFVRQWSSLKSHCNQKDVHIIGDMPVYVDHDSVDVWANPGIFKLDKEKKPYVVAGVPPDYFSETGQLWGNPLYRWDILKEIGYDWWVRRIETNLRLVDFLRIDHFRGFVAYWEVSAGEKTAIDAAWFEVPAVDFFSRLSRRFPQLPIIAEDLGLITPDVREIMQLFEVPGMKVLLFAFGEDLPANPYIPHNLIRNCVLYTGTHDNNTVRGWFEREATPDDKKRLRDYLGREVSAEDVHWELIRLAMMSVANTVISPMQDLLGLGAEARMNLPATMEGNWRWQLLEGQLAPSLARRLSAMTEIYGRA